MDIHYIGKRFIDLYENGGNTMFFFSPCRVNLIGEHTDYNGGYVFPCALSLGTYAAARKRNDGLMRFASGNFPKRAAADITDLSYKTEDGWANYLKGVALEFQKAGYKIGGMDIYIEGDIPNGAGLSSSASVELLMGAALNSLFNCGMDRLEMVKLCQRAENGYMGVNCGVMDQYAVGMGKTDCALLLDCGKLTHEYVPLQLKGCKLIISDTNKRRKLADSAYNTRRAECERAVRDLRAKYDINLLCELSEEAFNVDKGLIKNEVDRRRAAHAIAENARTVKAVEYLKIGDLAAFGSLMNQSHISLRDLYEVTGPELDAMAEAAWQAPGVLGSRMTGAGFGGCTVTLVKEADSDAFISHTGRQYQKHTGLSPMFYTADVGDGAKRIYN
ncbi:MAG: galactokinase [Clostridiales bacterium]|jgi:galactokinase|nr:galactokinase [Clostridiales bacterium]